LGGAGLWPPEKGVRLHLGLPIQEDGRIVCQDDIGLQGHVLGQPTNDETVRTSVVANSNRRWHVDDPFNQLGLLQARVRQIPAVELFARQMVACFEGDRCFGVSGHVRHLVL
jgi:hypothetical protein